MVNEFTTSLDKENSEIQKRYRKNLKAALRLRSLIIKSEEVKHQRAYAKTVPIIDQNALFWIGLALYWAEGAKTERWRAVFYNSDPAINKAMMRFFREICGVSDDDIRIQLVLHDAVSEDEAKCFWSKELSVPVGNFFHASYARSRASKGKRPVLRLPYGTVQISVRGKPIANKIKGWLLGISKQFNLRA